MPQHKGAVRRARLSEKRKVANKGQKVELRKLLKGFDPSAATSADGLKALQSKLDKLASKGLPSLPALNFLRAQLLDKGNF